jgi:hypothetical protein
VSDPFVGFVLLLMLVALVACVVCGVRSFVQRSRKRRRSAWYRVDTMRKHPLDYRDYQSQFRQSELPSILRRQAE